MARASPSDFGFVRTERDNVRRADRFPGKMARLTISVFVSTTYSDGLGTSTYHHRGVHVIDIYVVSSQCSSSTYPYGTANARVLY